jgi:hypothetical protein
MAGNKMFGELGFGRGVKPAKQTKNVDSSKQ